MDLVLLGDGALRPLLEQRRDALGLGPHLLMHGFKQVQRPSSGTTV